MKEVNSFIFKFNQLWNSGFAADLNFKCYAGQAFATLQVGLGCAENVFTPSSGPRDFKTSKHVSPSQLRRRVRRENARSAEKAADDDMSNVDEKMGESIPTDVAENIDTVENKTEENSVIEIVSQFDSKLDGKITEAETLIDSSKENVANSETAEVLKNEVFSGNKSTVQEQIESLVDAEEVLAVDTSTNELPKKDMQNVNAIESKDAVVLPEIVDVFATATFSLCAYSQLSQDDLDSLYRFITSKEHLKKNIASIHYDKIYSLGSDNAGTFEHAVQFRIGVRRQNLWEGPRSYIWKHLGSDVWERGSGTLIKLSHIHQK